MRGLDDDIDVYHQTPADKSSSILKLKQKIARHGLDTPTIFENQASSHDKHRTNQIKRTNSLKALKQKKKKNQSENHISPWHLPLFLGLLCSYKSLKDFSCPVDVSFLGRHNFAFSTEEGDMKSATDPVREELSRCERGDFQMN